MIIEVMIEDNDGQAPDPDRMADWADTYGLTMPVLAGSGDLLWSYAESSSIGLPYTMVVDPGAEIFSIESGTQVDLAVRQAKKNK